MVWEAFDINVLNESTFLFRPTQDHPKLVQNGTLIVNDESSELSWTILQDQKGPLVSLKSIDHGDASAILSFGFDDPNQKLVIWARIIPDQNAAGIRGGIFRADQEIDSEFLDSLTPDAFASGDNGVVCEVSVNGKRHALGVAAQVDVFMIDADRTDFNMSNPSAWIYIRDLAYQVKKPEAPDPAQMPFVIAGGLNHSVNQPIHENMSLCALVLAQVTRSDITYETVADYAASLKFDEVTKRWAAGEFEYIRGVIWNDDPACALFVDNPYLNSLFGTGFDWFLSFKRTDWPRYILPFLSILSGNPASILDAKKDEKENAIIARSHYGDLQFLHSMGCKKDEDPKETKRKIMIWLEVMYKLACGNQGITPGTRISDTPLREFFNDQTAPQASEDLRRLLLGKTTHLRPEYLKLEKRALGSCFHTIQDSYAVGHCKRILSNPEDKISTKQKPSVIDMAKAALFSGIMPVSVSNPASATVEVFKFKDGRPGRFKAIQNFHCYDGQDDDKHGFYDKVDDVSQLKPDQPLSFSNIIGGLDAIDKCSILAKAWSTRESWDGVKGVGKWLDEDVFALAGDASPSNTEVSI